MPAKSVRKIIVKVYPRELLRVEGMSPEKFDKLRTYSAEKRKQLIAEKQKQLIAEMQEQAVTEMRERAVVKKREQAVAESAQDQCMTC